jgi:cephalosporin hydroxylase
MIIETGTAWGGSALYMASLLDIIGSGRVVSIDLEKRSAMPEHDRINFLAGRSSIEPSLVAEVADLTAGERVMVVLDSDHSKAHVLAEMDAYARLVSPGCYLIVEDMHLNGHPVQPKFGPGPMEAVDEWVPQHPQFERTSVHERYLVSMNPGGYLRGLENSHLAVRPDGGVKESTSPSKTDEDPGVNPRARLKHER